MPDLDERPTGELWLRAAEVVGVSYPKRAIDLVVIPYETETTVVYQGRSVVETIGRGAFDGIERRANRVRVNRDHSMERTVGRAVAFHPGHDDGLVAELRIARTPLGDETLELAEEGCLDASAGFAPMPGGLTWDGPTRYRVTKAFLGHIAMTPDPAYPDARVLAVRAHDPATGGGTPNLDLVRGYLIADRLAALQSGLSLDS